MTYLLPSLGVSVIFSADAIDKLPSHCNTIVQWEKDYSGCYNTLSKFEEREGETVTVK